MGQAQTTHRGPVGQLVLPQLPGNLNEKRGDRQECSPVSGMRWASESVAIAVAVVTSRCGGGKKKGKGRAARAPYRDRIRHGTASGKTSRTSET